jgi:hypothetical protein
VRFLTTFAARSFTRRVKMLMAGKQQAEQWAEHRRQRVMVITEFDAGDPEGDPARPGRRDSEVPPSPAAAGSGDRLGGCGRAIRTDRTRALLASEAHA